MADFTDVERIARDLLPDTMVGTSYGTAAILVRKKMVCRLWSQREHDRDDVHDTAVLVVRGQDGAKATVIETADGVVFETPHYHGHDAMLIRLDDVDTDLLAELIEDSYRVVAPKTLIRRLDQS